MTSQNFNRFITESLNSLECIFSLVKPMLLLASVWDNTEARPKQTQEIRSTLCLPPFSTLRKKKCSYPSQHLFLIQCFVTNIANIAYQAAGVPLFSLWQSILLWSLTPMCCMVREYVLTSITWNKHRALRPEDLHSLTRVVLLLNLDKGSNFTPTLGFSWVPLSFQCLTLRFMIYGN